jgi:hypothetical protein
MTRKLLTALDQMETAIATTVTHSTVMQQMLTLQRETAIKEAIEITVKQTLPFLNVQRLMAIETALRYTRYIAPLLPAEARRTIQQALIRPYEEEQIERKHILPRYVTQKFEQQKIQRLTSELIELETVVVPLHDWSMLMIEQQIFAELEKTIMQKYQLQTLQALQKIVEACINKQWYIEPIKGLEHLQKLLALLYFYVMMEYPQAYCMLGVKVSPLTMMLLRHKCASLYMTYAMSKQESRQKAVLKSATKKKEEKKVVEAGKKRYEIIPSREHAGTTEDLTEETQVTVGKDDFGREMFFTALRYAYGIPYRIRRLLVRMYGMPENHKYAKYFGIGCIPTRRTMFGYKKARYGKEPWTVKSRDDYIKWFKERFGKEPVGVPYSGRYGGFKFALGYRAMRPPYYTPP